MVAVHDALPFPSESSIILITSTLGTPPNWLLHAYVAATLHPQSEGPKGRGVVLVSFVNDQRFLREGLKRGVGIDSVQYERVGRLKILDGLSRLFESGYTSTAPKKAPQLSGTSQQASQAIPSNGTATKDTDLLCLELSPDGGPKLKGTYDIISQSLRSLTSSETEKPMLVIESPDILLATTSLPAYELWDFLLDLREISHSIVITLSADTPLLSPAISLATNIFNNQQQPPLGAGAHTRLETQHSAFMGMAIHNAEWVVGLRLLDTGVARDVSGVLRVTRGGVAQDGGEKRDSGAAEKERELLYYLGEGGGVEIFDRGGVRHS